jgi:RimJ/RimL family protein N-acetyltransferase
VLARPALDEDVPAAARVHHGSSEAACAFVPNAPTLSDREALWRGVLERSDRWPYVVEAKGEIVGVLIIGPSAEPETGELYVLYVHPDWWGTGAAQQLIDRAHDQFERRFQRAVLTVMATNFRARRFYERNGWAVEEIVRESSSLFSGEAVEVARYRKNFS